MNRIKQLVTLGLLLSPMLAFATTGDSTFGSIYTELKGYITGSLGMVFVILGFIGACAAVAGFAPMKVMFPVFGLTLALKYGAGIIEKIFGAPSDVLAFGYVHPHMLNAYDLGVFMLASAVFVAGYYKHKKVQPQ